MAKVLLTVELEYDRDLMHEDSEEGRDWFFEEILMGDKLLLHSNEIGDTVGEVKVCAVMEIA